MVNIETVANGGGRPAQSYKQEKYTKISHLFYSTFEVLDQK